jgi:nicotinamide riboside kinase
MEENLKQQRSNVIKIALFGPESTGKTTLAKQLADHFKTNWAPEFARNYLEEKLKESGQICQPDDLLPIAIGQTKNENEALLTANQYLFCDTCLMVTKVFSEIYFNFCDPELEKAARKHEYDLFFLTDVDVTWEKDSLRDSPNNREEIFQIFRDELIKKNKPFILLRGDSQTRLTYAIEVIEELTEAKSLGFTSHDFVDIKKKSIRINTIKEHLEVFSKGISKVNLVRAATIDDGIVKLSETQFSDCINYFESNIEKLKLLKFVPASGAASRMFKFLNEFINDFDLDRETINSYINKKNMTNLSLFLAGIDKFPFYETVRTIQRELYSDYPSWSSDKKYYYFIKLLLDPAYFNFSNKPKAILPFHKYPTHTATPIEEHLNEAALYSSSNGTANLHFTISEIHKSQFEKIIENEIRKVENKYGTKINIEFSFQNASTDTLAVTVDNLPFRNESGNLVFRPAGHGALLNNLNNIDADIIFIKNIDNVIQNHAEIVADQKRALAGYLLKNQKWIFEVLNQIEKQQLKESEINDLVEFIEKELNIVILEDFHKYTFENKISEIKKILNRPIRVCGMVKNEGEPGGGPFWTIDSKGRSSLQIVESSQIDMQNPTQATIFTTATYFNPVDIVCSFRNFRGEKFDLNDFVDHQSGFIVYKNKNGQNIKAYELPGLWNGSMADWITIFVEVPLITFNPVKTVNDLLKPSHQPQ